MRDKIKRLLLVMITVLMTFVNAVPMNVMAKDLSNPDRAAIIKEAEKHEGKPYVYGGNGPDSFDCSGFTKYVFQHSIGFTLERTAEAQRQQLIKSGQQLSKTDKSQWKPGDLVFFGNHGIAEHVAIYYGDDEYIHAIGDKVQVTDADYLIDKDGEIYQVLTVIKMVEDLGGFTILKTDEDGNALSGAKFKITMPDGSSTTRTTGKNGKIILKDVANGQYKIQETYSPEGFLIDDTVRTITVKAGDDPSDHVYSFVNKQPTGEITLTKYNEDRSSTIPGTKYHVTSDTGYEADHTTDKNGRIHLTGLKLGTYTFTEVQAANGFLLNKEPVSITLSYKDQHTSVIVGSIEQTNKEPSGKIVLTKYNADKSSVIPGTTYRVTGPNGFDETVKTNSEGKLVIDGLKLGTYTLTEVQAADGYLLDSKPITVSLSYKDQYTELITGTAEQTNAEPTATIKLKKEDKETGATAQGDATLEGAVYELVAGEDIYNKAKTKKYYTKGDIVATRETDASGAMDDITGLPLGNYQLREKTPSLGYLLDENVYDIRCTYENQTVSVITRSQVSKEQVKKQAFQIIKISTDETGEASKVPEAEFTVKLASDVEKNGWDKAKVYDILTTDENGYALSIELPYGRYQARETKVPENLMPVADFFIDITEDSREPQVWRIMNDASFKALIKAVKVDEETGKTVLLSDASFRIRNVETGEYVGHWVWFPLPHYVDTYTTDETGTVMTADVLEAGEYELVEIEAPYGYILNDEPVKFTVTNRTAYEMAEDGKTPIIRVSMKDVSAKGKISVIKTGEHLTDVSKDDDGNIQFIYENGPIDGAFFTVKAAEDILSADQQGDIIYEKGETVAELTTSSGEAQTIELPLGKYTVEESAAGEGFVLNKEIKEIELKYADQYTPVVFEETEYINERQKAEISVIKKDKDTAQLLSGAKFGLYAKENIYAVGSEKLLVEEGQLIETALTDKEGKAVFKADLPLYKFEIREIQPPIGYVSTDAVYEADCTYQGQDVEVIKLTAYFENEITKTEISKKDATTGEELPGAHLTLKEKDGTVFETWISTNEPHIVKGLEPGKTYELIETSSPYGFAISQTVEFTVTDTGVVQKVEMIDEMVMGKLKWLKTGEVFTGTEEVETEFGIAKKPVFGKKIISNAEIDIYADEEIKLANDIVYYEKDELIESLKSGDEPVESKELPVGKYYYIERVVPEPFVQDMERHYFEIEDNQKNELQIIESELENTRAKVNLELQKIMEEHPYYVDDYKEAYKKVAFGIYASEDIMNYADETGIAENTLIAVCGIDENGHLMDVPELPIGSYHIVEMATDDNYIVSEESFDFEITYEGKDVPELNIAINEGKEIVNMLKRTDIVISKIDKISKDPLPDVEFTLFDRDMNVIATAVSDKDGIARFEDMPNGIYFCKETKALEGYALSEEVIRIELTGDSKDNEYHVTMTNVLLPAKGESVQTGDTSNIILWISAAAVSGVIVLATLKVRKRNGRKK